MFVFGLLVWFYVILIQVTYPAWLPQPFSHLTFPPLNWRVDEVGIIAFVVAAVGFFLWQVEQTQSGTTH